MTGEGLDDKDLAISKLLRQDMQKYRSLFSHVSAAIQSRKYPLKGDTIQHIYTDSKHSNPICRVTPIENLKSLSHMIRKSTKKRYSMQQRQFLGSLVLIDLLTAVISKRIMGEGSGGGMKS